MTDNYIEIELTKGFTAKIDEDDFEKVQQHCWQYQQTSKNHGYAGASIKDGDKYKRVLMHRFVMNAQKGDIVDHLNRDCLDNRKCNLRITTQKQNKLNSIGFGNVKYKGVHKRNRRLPYVAAIKIPNGKTKNLGSYDSAEKAALAYNEAAYAIYGERVRLNEIIE